MTGRAALALAAALLAAPGHARADAERIPLEAFFRDPILSDVQLSPSGKHLAAFRSENGKRSIVILDATSGDIRGLLQTGDARVSRFWWANDERILFNNLLRGGLERRLGAIDIDGKNLLDAAKHLDPGAGLSSAWDQRYGDEIIDLLPEDPRKILVGYLGFRSGQLHTSYLFTLDVYSGRTSRVAGAEKRVQGWITDPSGVPRIAWGKKQDRPFFLYRESQSAAWLELAQPRSFVAGDFLPLATSADPKKIYAAARVEGDLRAIHLFDTGNRSFARLFRGEGIDVDGPLLFSAGGQGSELIGVGYRDDHRRVFWIDPDWKRQMAAVDAALPGRVNRPLSRTRDDRKLVIRAVSDHHPAAHYVLERDGRGLVFVGSEYPGLDPARLTEVRAVSYEARDGLRIPAFLTVPRGSESKPGPAIILVHGGPQGRVDREFDPEVQFFASRGWAVLQPNFRGSTGYGRRHERSGHGQWGLAMQDDISDGVRWLVEQGIADPRRICIYGSGYGGYSALMGLIRTPELYRCGASYGGVSNLVDLLDDEAASGSVADLIGGPGRDHEKLRQVSPELRAAEIRNPVFLAHGTDDRVVRVRQTQNMARALERAGKPHELLVLDGEINARRPDWLIDDELDGFWYEASRLEFYRRLEAFLSKHLDRGVRE
jgi:dipeptidyl aminopeptidase/acylaminoacyl peptidase